MSRKPPIVRTTCFARLLPLLLFLTLPAVLHAQFTFETNNGAITVTGYTGSGGAVIIPSTINGLPVTRIQGSAFTTCINLASVTIPNSVTSIEEWVFGYCASLTNVTIPNSVTTIGSSAFYHCTSLGSVTIPNSVTSIGSYAFSSCTSLSSVTIPNSVTSIGSYAFFYCTSLAGVMIGNSVTSIGERAFGRCGNLTGITVDALNSAYGSVDGVLFNKSQTTLIQCPGGKTGSYTIPNSVTSIGDRAFEYCANLTSVTVGKSVTSIGNYAFNYCTSLTAVYCRGNAPSLGWSVFDDDNNPTVYYVSGTTGWDATYGGCPTALWSPTNAPPVLSPIAGQIVLEETLLTFTASVSDADLDRLAFSLDPPAPEGASINTNSGVFTWTPSLAYGSTTHSITVRVTDDGSPAASDAQTFNVIVVARPRLLSIAESPGGGPTFVWQVHPGRNYRFEFKNSLFESSWMIMSTNTAETSSLTNHHEAGTNRQGFYRLLDVPAP